MPPSKCRVTMAGFSSSVTVHMPRSACPVTTSTSVWLARQPASPRRRARRQSSQATPAIMNPSPPAR